MPEASQIKDMIADRVERGSPHFKTLLEDAFKTRRKANVITNSINRTFPENYDAGENTID